MYWGEKDAEFRVEKKEPWRRWQDCIKINLTETGWDGVDWVHLPREKHKWLWGGVLLGASVSETAAEFLIM